MSNTFPLAWIPVLPLIGALFAGVLGNKVSKKTVGFVSTAVVFGAFLFALAATYKLLVLGNIPPFATSGAAKSAVAREFDVLYNTNVWTWIQAGSFKVELGFWMDSLSAVMTLLITFVGGLIHLYSTGYMHDDKSFARYFCYLNLFTASMLILVLGKNLLMLFIGWEGVGLCSYLLIGFWFEDNAKASAGKKAFIVNRVGDFGFLLGIFTLLACQYQAGQTLSLDYVDLKGMGAIWNNLVSGGVGTVAGWDWTWATVAALFLFIGATGKSAQVPLYVWLPDAMAGPTPVSALIHAATMVTAGVFMIARLGFVFAFSPEALGVVGLVGGITALFAALMAVPQNDIKKVLAYSTVSQLGLMFVVMGTGAFWVGIFHVLTHAFFKACLFLGSGSVIHGMGGEQDIRKMGGLRKYMPHTFWTFTIATFAIAGVPPLAGFFSKDEILWQAFSTTNPVFPTLKYVTYGMAALASLLTAFYMTRLWVRTFLGECRADEETKHHLHESPASMTIPLWILAFLSAFGGLIGVSKLIAGMVVGYDNAGKANQLLNFLDPVLLRANERLAVSGLRPEISAAEEASHHSAELALMGLSIVVALLGIGVAYALYKNNKLPKFVPAPIYRLVLNKFYVDELYHGMIVTPLHGISFLFHLLVDETIIDALLVRGGPRLIRASSAVFRRVQTGNIQPYAGWLAIGLAVILYMVLR